MACPICEKRPPKRFCPAKGEKICADLLRQRARSDHRLPLRLLVPDRRASLRGRAPQAASRRRISRTAISSFPPDFVYEHWPVVSNIAEAILGFQIQNKELNDNAVYAALESLAETYRTLGTGIYYEKPPDLPVARALYGQIAESLQNFRKQDRGTARASLPR